MTLTQTPDLKEEHPSGGLSELMPAVGDRAPGVRLTPAFITESKQLGSRPARLALLEAYERARGDEWCLRVALVARDGRPVVPQRTTRGLLELVAAITQIVDALPSGIDASIEVRPDPSAERRPRPRTGRVVALSLPSQHLDSLGTAASTIVTGDS